MWAATEGASLSLSLLSSARLSYNIFVFYKARMCLQVLRGDFWIPFKSFPVRVGAKIPVTQQPHPRGSSGDNNFKNRVTDAWLERGGEREREWYTKLFKTQIYSSTFLKVKLALVQCVLFLYWRGKKGILSSPSRTFFYKNIFNPSVGLC